MSDPSDVCLTTTSEMAFLSPSRLVSTCSGCAEEGVDLRTEPSTFVRAASESSSCVHDKSPTTSLMIWEVGQITGDISLLMTIGLGACCSSLWPFSVLEAKDLACCKLFVVLMAASFTVAESLGAGELLHGCVSV